MAEVRTNIDGKPLYGAMNRYAPLEKDFWDNTEPIPFSGCFIWMRSLGSYGYGQIVVRGKLYRTHRYAWELVNGPIPKGLWVLHACDTPSCVNPRHLFLGTRADNMRDCAKKGRIKGITPEANRKKTHCPKGHPYDEENTYWRKTSRHCRACLKANTDRWNAKVKEARANAKRSAC